jgi:hypothetical protein
VIILGKYVTIFNKARIWCKCTRTKVHRKLFSSVDKEANIRSPPCIRRFMIDWEHYLWTICPFAHTRRNNTNIYILTLFNQHLL